VEAEGGGCTLYRWRLRGVEGVQVEAEGGGGCTSGSCGEGVGCTSGG